jgi:hypothetical protein
MIQSTVTPFDEPADAALRDALAQGNAMLRSLAPVMRHLLTGAQHAVFADEIIARVRGGVGDVARQLLDAVAEAGTTRLRSMPCLPRLPTSRGSWAMSMPWRSNGS